MTQSPHPPPSLPCPSPFVNRKRIISSRAEENEEAEKKSHKISGKNNFLCFWYQWWWCMIECLCYRQYKVKHKNMFGVKSTVFIRFYFRREREEGKESESNGTGEGEVRWIIEWRGVCETQFYYRLENLRPLPFFFPSFLFIELTPVIFAQRYQMVLCIILWVLSRNKKDKCTISPDPGESDAANWREARLSCWDTLLNKHINIYFIEECDVAECGEFNKKVCIERNRRVKIMNGSMFHP